MSMFLLAARSDLSDDCSREGSALPLAAEFLFTGTLALDIVFVVLFHLESQEIDL